MIQITSQSKCTQELIGKNILKPTEGNLLTTIETFPINQEIKLDVKITGNLMSSNCKINAQCWLNLFHIADKTKQENYSPQNSWDNDWKTNQGMRLTSIQINYNNKIIQNCNNQSSNDKRTIYDTHAFQLDKWETIITRVEGNKQSLIILEESGNQLQDSTVINTYEDRKVWKNAGVYFSDNFFSTTNKTEVKNFVITDLDCSGSVSSTSQIESSEDWVAKCYQDRSTNLTDDNLDNCLVTADFGTAKECFKCENGYTYDEKQHCITLADADTQGICTSLTGVPASTDECSYCDGGKGNTCAEGTVLVSDGSCVTAITNCDNQDCDGNCLECLNGQYLAQDMNVCVASIDHCVDQESTGECLNCQAEYVEVADDKCCPEILNCKVQNAETCGVCDQVCELGETEQNDICHVIIPNCANQNDDSTCDFCENGFKVAVDNANVCVPELPHCSEQLESGDCQTCNNDYVLVADDEPVSYKLINGAKFLTISKSDANFKNEWKQTMAEIQEMAAQATKVAIYDEDGNQVVSKPNEWPIMRMRNGLALSHDGNTDINTIKDEWTSSNDSSMLNQLTQTCKTVNTDLSQVVQHSCGNHNGLHFGIGNYYYYSKWDFKGDSLKLYVAIDQQIETQSKCVPVIPECETYDYTTGECRGCVAAQELAYDDDVCVPQIPYCSVYQADSECYECVAGYLGLSPAQCHEYIPECITQGCSGACEACAYGYVVLGGKCSPVIPYCQDYSSNGDCATCISGYTSHNHECHDDNHCGSYNCDGTCVKCAEGHTLTEQGVCTDTA